MKSFLKQRISLEIQVANAVCVLGTINDKTTFEENFIYRAKGTKAQLYIGNDRFVALNQVSFF